VGSLARVFGFVSDESQVETLRGEAERLRSILDAHEDALDAARAALADAQDRQSEIASVEADAATGDITAQEADERKREIREALAQARERVETEERLVVELGRRVTEAGHAVARAVLAEAAPARNAARHAPREAEKVVELRRSELAAEDALYDQAAARADEIVREFDAEARKDHEARRRRQRELVRSLLGYSDETILARHPRSSGLLEEVRRMRAEHNAGAVERAEETTRATWERMSGGLDVPGGLAPSEPFPSVLDRFDGPRERPAGDGVAPRESWPRTG